LDYLRACLASLYRHTQDITFEVIVINNDARDDCKSLLQEFPALHLIETGENLGFARANNLGYSRSQGAFLLFLNPDTEIIGGALARMVAHLRWHPAVGVAGARLLNSDGSLQTSCVQAFPTLGNQLLESQVLRRLVPTWRLWGTRALFQGQPPDADFVSGACLMVKRSVFERVGRFGEEYFMYADDLDLCYKVRRAGYTVHCLNECQVIHHGGKSSAQQTDSFSGVLQRESLALFLRKTRGPWYCGAYHAAMAGMALIRLSLIICLIPFSGTGLLQGKAPRSVFRKWSRILRWALGFAEWSRPAGASSFPLSQAE
jgi:GT2 family glycosyltransferase